MADLLMEEALESMAEVARKQGLPYFVVQGRIAEGNKGSTALVQRFEFECTATETGQVAGLNGDQEVPFGVWQVELPSE